MCLKKILTFIFHSSSVTPHSTTKVHPVMSKLQAHMALAAISQQTQQNNKMKHVHRHNSGSHEFSPPSQIVSNYANYEAATRIPLWHHGFPNNNNNNYNNQQQYHHQQQQQNPHSHHGEFHHHFHKPEAQAQSQQQVLPSVHPSIITPFLEQVHLKQKQVAAAEQKHSFKQSHESNSNENNGSFEVVNDVFSKHLVPPPPSSSKTHQKQKHSKQAPEKHTKFNLSMPSPLQDASRFNYNNVVSTAATPNAPSSTIAIRFISTSTPSTSYKELNEIKKYRPSSDESQSEEQGEASEKPNVFFNLNRSKENPYKHHKLLHPSYSGGNGLKKTQTFNQDKAFLPTPYKPTEERNEEIKIDYEPQRSYFTIEDAVTPHFPESMKYDYHGDGDELEIITLRPQIRPTKEYYAVTSAAPQFFSTTTTTTTTDKSIVEPAATAASPKPKQKLRRRKPKPQNQQNFLKEQTEHQVSDEQLSENSKPIRTRGSIRNSNSSVITQENELRTRNRLNHPNRVRARPNLTSPAATLSTTDYDYTIKSFDDELRRSETVPTMTTTTTTTQGTTESTSAKSIESSEQQPENVRHRVRLRYKNKLSSKVNSYEGLDFKQKLSDSQISDTEHENVVVKQPNEETTEFSIGTENPFSEIKSSLKLPNLKLRNEVFTTIQTTAEDVSSPASTLLISSTAITTTSEHDENNPSQKILNRPRFSIKELKRKQYLTSSPSTAASSLSSATASASSLSTTTTHKPDSNRFNRFRLNLNRRRNETNESSEEIEIPRKRYSSTRFSSSTTTTSTTESPPQSTKRGLLPKRTFPARNFTKPSSQNLNNESETTIPKSTTNKSATTNRQNTRQRIQNYKKKDTSNEVASSPIDHEDTVKNVNNFNYDTTIVHELPATTGVTTTTTTSGAVLPSTELPITRAETSIMKIAKTSSPSSIIIKATTSNNNLIVEDTLPSSALSERHDSTDLVGSPSEHSQRVAELTISGNEDSTFKSANIGLLSRRIPNYFTISTDDPILPIQAFFPQIKTNESVSIFKFSEISQFA